MIRLSHIVPPRVHLSNIRLHSNAWHTRRRYQQRTNSFCMFCRDPEAEDSIEHIVSCPSVQQILPAKLKTGPSGKVGFQTWLLFGLDDPERMLMSLYVHAIYTIHNMYRHSCDRGEFKQTVERIVLEIPLSQQLQANINNAILDGHSRNHSKTQNT